MSDFAQGDAIRYSGTLGDYDGTVVAVKPFFDENGAQATLYDVALPGVGLVRTSADSLTAANKPSSPDITIPREAYSDTSVPPVEVDNPDAVPTGEPERAADGSSVVSPVDAPPTSAV